MKYTRCFLEESTGQFFRTIRAARQAVTHPLISRVWVDIDGVVRGQVTVFDQTHYVNTISIADRFIGAYLNATS